MPLFITINGTDHEIPFTFDAVAALCTVVGEPKFANLEKMVSKIGFDNLPRILQAMFKAEGLTLSTDEIKSGLSSPKFGIDFINALGKSMQDEDAEEIKENIASGN